MEYRTTFKFEEVMTREIQVHGVWWAVAISVFFIKLNYASSKVVLWLDDRGYIDYDAEEENT